MNMMVWWFVLMIPAWVLAAYVLWGTNIVVAPEDDEDAEADSGVESGEEGGG